MSIRAVVTRGMPIAALLLFTAACGSNKDARQVSSAATPTPAQAAPITPQPAGPAPGTEDHFLVNVQDRVLFDLDRYDLDQEARSILVRQAEWLRQYPAVTLIVEGHADERGTREYNLALGSRRANSVKDFLVSQGVAPSRVRTISYGKERPVAPGSNEAAWRLNRRGVTVIRALPGS